MESPGFFFVQAVNDYQVLNTELTPVMTLNVYSRRSQAVTKLDFSIQFVSSIKSTVPSIVVQLVRDGNVLSTHVVQFEQNRQLQEENFVVTTDSLTWTDAPSQGINLYQVTAAVMGEEQAEEDVFAASRSFNATVFA
jgi:hypothetical protein